MIVVTSKASNDIAVDVVINGNHEVIHPQQFQVIKSDELTPSIEHLSNIGLVSYTEIVDSTDTKDEQPQRGRRGRNISTEETEKEDEGGN